VEGEPTKAVIRETPDHPSRTGDPPTGNPVFPVIGAQGDTPLRRLPLAAASSPPRPCMGAHDIVRNARVPRRHGCRRLRGLPPPPLHGCGIIDLTAL